MDEQWVAAPYAQWKFKAYTGGGKGRHLWPRLVRKIAEGKTAYELSSKVKVTIIYKSGQKLRVELESTSDDYISKYIHIYGRSMA